LGLFIFISLHEEGNLLLSSLLFSSLLVLSEREFLIRVPFKFIPFPTENTNFSALIFIDTETPHI